MKTRDGEKKLQQLTMSTSNKQHDSLDRTKQQTNKQNTTKAHEGEKKQSPTPPLFFPLPPTPEFYDGLRTYGCSSLFRMAADNGIRKPEGGLNEADRGVVCVLRWWPVDIGACGGKACAWDGIIIVG